MEKYVVCDWPRDEFDGDMFEKYVDSPEEATREASYRWEKMSRFDKKRRQVFSGLIREDSLPEEAFTEEGIYWEFRKDIDTYPGCFDSEEVTE